MSTRTASIKLRWFARAQPPRWRVRIGESWHDVVEPWVIEAQHRGLARPHLEALARATYAHHANVGWHEALQMLVTALYENDA